MLLVARQARTAYSKGPVQNRRCVAGQNLRSQYTDAVAGWLDTHASNLLYNQTSAFWNDGGYNSPNSVANWQSTAYTSAQYALNSVSSNVRGVQFDGVDDITQAASNVLLGGQAITIVAVYRNFSASDAVIAENGTGYTSQTTAFILSGSSTAATSAFRGDVGTCLRTWASTQNQWVCTATVQDKTAGLGAEILVYENGTQVTSFTAATNADNTNTFASGVVRIGRRAGGTLPMNGVVSGVMIFNRKLTLAEIQQVTQLLRWRAGLS